MTDQEIIDGLRHGIPLYGKFDLFAEAADRLEALIAERGEWKIIAEENNSWHSSIIEQCAKLVEADYPDETRLSTIASRIRALKQEPKT